MQEILIVKSQDGEVEKEEKWKGAAYMILYGLVISVSLLFAQYEYQRHAKTMHPIQLLFGRSFFSCFFSILIVNKDLKRYMYDEVPQTQFKNLAKRCLQSASVTLLDFSIIKYISLVFQSVAKNLTPIATIILSAYMTGEKFNCKKDLAFSIISLLGVTFVTVGFGLDKKE